MISHSVIAVFVKRSSVKMKESVHVAREMTWHPIEQYAYSIFMKFIYQKGKIFLTSISAAWRKIAGNSISPRSEKRVLHSRHKLNVCKAHFFHIRHQLGSKFAV